MLTVFTLLAGPAWACDEDQAVDVLAISPEDGSVGVPLDARVVLQVRGRGALEAVGVSLSDTRGIVPGEWSVERTEGMVGIWTFTPAGGFSPDEAYRIALDAPATTDAGYEGDWAVEFETGDHDGAGLAVDPELALVSVGQATTGMESRCEPVAFRRVEAMFTPGEVRRPSEEWMFLYLADEGGDRLLEAKRLDSRDWGAALQVLVPEPGEAFCLFAVHRNASGDEGVSNPACFEAEGLPDDALVAYYGGGTCGGGCASVSPVFGVWALVPWFLRRRRVKP